MLKLFKYEDYEVKVEPEALLLQPFKKLSSKYRKDKGMLQLVLAFIYFFSDPRSDYMYMIDKQSRMEAIKLALGIEDSWEPDDDVNAAIEFYESFKPLTAGLLEDSYAAVDKLRRALREIDFMQVDDKGKPIYPLDALTRTVKIVPSLVKDLQDAEKAVNSEIKDNSRMRGGQEKKLFEDGITL